MSKKRENDSKKSRADLLIEEALKAVESSEPDSEEGALAEKPQVRSDTAPIAKIDLQKFVDREAYLRLAADFENFRKRALKERVEAEKVGKENALRGFLEILDNFDRALSQAQNEAGAFADGIRMIMSQMESWLKTEGFTRIETVGKTFDPSVHEAVSQVKRMDLPHGEIVQEARRGYRCGDRLLRPASVVVNKTEETGPQPNLNKEDLGD